MKSKKNIICVLGGMVLWLGGFWLAKKAGISWETLRVLPYLMIGIGCGLFGYGVGELVNRRVMDSNPALAKEQEIAQKDERNVALANRAKAKAYDLMTYMMAALLLTFALMGGGDGGHCCAGAGLSGNRVLRALLAAAAGKGKLKFFLGRSKGSAAAFRCGAPFVLPGFVVSNNSALTGRKVWYMITSLYSTVIWRK